MSHHYPTPKIPEYTSFREIYELKNFLTNYYSLNPRAVDVYFMLVAELLARNECSIDCTSADIARRSFVCKKSLTSYFVQLEEAGLLKRENIPNKKGRSQRYSPIIPKYF